VELIDVFLILGVFLPVFFVAVWQLNRVNPTKKGVKAGDSSIKEMYSVYNQQVTDVLKVKDKQISSLSAKLRTFDEENEEIIEEIPAKLDGLKPLLASRGINPAILENPFVQKLIKKYTKDMSIEDIVQIAQQFGLLKGNTQLESGATVTGQGNPNYF